MFKTARILVLLAVPALLGGTNLKAATPVQVGPSAWVLNASPNELDLVRWAIGRYDRAGLALPPLEFAFHVDVSGCEGRTGLYHSGIVDLCPVVINPTTQHTVLHEMAHAWTETNDGAAVRARFLKLRDLDTWNSWDEPWPDRGWEQAAEAISWTIGDRTLPLWSLPHHDPTQILAAYTVLTGRRPPAARPAGRLTAFSQRT
ncbi:MAG TPA: hypothetical protein VLX89_01130 [Actinomycetota bacterium]|nr:hypothetical protein [Actinomycetota bacterium]